MLLSAIKENDNNETRVSISPESVKLFSRLGFEVLIENGAGETSGYQNSNYEEAGANIVTRSECLKADVCLCVRMPSTDDINILKSNSLLIGILNPYENKSEFPNLNKNKFFWGFNTTKFLEFLMNFRCNLCSINTAITFLYFLNFIFH